MAAVDHDDLPVAVMGAGPVGLAAAAHLARRGLPFVVLEAGETVGAAVRSWGHIRMFTPWRWIVDAAAAEVLTPTGWSAPQTPAPPTGAELVGHYLQPLAAALAPRVRTGHRVLAVSRAGLDKAWPVGRADRPFALRVRRSDGTTTDVRARAVIDASGTWQHPNPLGAGLPALGEQAAAAHLVGPLPDVLGADRSRFAQRRTLVVGAGHSAANTLLDLERLAGEEPGTSIRWATRRPSPDRAYGGGEADRLRARGRLGTAVRAAVESGVIGLLSEFVVERLEVDGDTVTAVSADGRRLPGLHNIVAATGFRPDLEVLRELQLDLHPGLEAPRALAPLIDPAYHSCGTVPPHGHRDLAHPEPGFYIVGMKSYGRAPTFLITTGNEQVRSVVAAIAGDLDAADRVHLELPETGVCSGNEYGEDTAGDGCCGHSPTATELGVPAGAHRPRPAGLAARGFATGLAGGGAVAGAIRSATASAGGGCCLQ
jgi:cation diffusion facilitator CzcD-associated flavoprotein CzcO